jgi:hypothetical protein
VDLPVTSKKLPYCVIALLPYFSSFAWFAWFDAKKVTRQFIPGALNPDLSAVDVFAKEEPCFLTPYSFFTIPETVLVRNCTFCNCHYIFCNPSQVKSFLSAKQTKRNAVQGIGPAHVNLGRAFELGGQFREVLSQSVVASVAAV